jgi:uncharacterized protein YyaL (SSP411 family)
LRNLLASAKRKLFEARERRVKPGRDEKILTAWNGLMIDALAQASAVLEEPKYLAAAAQAAEFLLGKMRGSDGRLFRTAGASGEAKLNGYLEDYSFVINALASLYEATFEVRWIVAALDLTRVMIEQFWDAEEGGFFYTGRDHERLIVRNKDPQDNAIPSGNSVAVTALLRLAELSGREDLREKAVQSLRLFRGLMAEHPMAAGQMLMALDFQLGPVQEFAVVGDPASEESRRVLRAILRGFRPNKVVALKADDKAEEVVPLLKGKMAAGGVTTYVCENFTCQAPLVGAAAVEEAIR